MQYSYPGVKRNISSNWMLEKFFNHYYTDCTTSDSSYAVCTTNSSISGRRRSCRWEILI